MHVGGNERDGEEAAGAFVEASYIREAAIRVSSQRTKEVFPNWCSNLHHKFVAGLNTSEVAERYEPALAFSCLASCAATSSWLVQTHRCF